jgi:hypothetical protein
MGRKISGDEKQYMDDEHEFSFTENYLIAYNLNKKTLSNLP